MPMHKRETGIALVEVFLSVLILSVGVVAAYQPLLASFSVLRYAADRLEADYLLSHQIWELKNQIAISKAFDTKQKNETLLGTRKPYQYEMKSQALSEDKRLFRVHFQVSWLDAGKNKSIREEIYLTVPRAVG